MLSIGPMAGGQAHYYADLAREDYYINGGEPLGHWWGTGAEKLKIKGEVKREDLVTLFNGFSPKGTPLVQNAGSRNRRPGFDLTFSAPKSVSVLWACARDDVRREIQHAQDAAVKAALGLLEDEGIFARTGKQGSHFHKAEIIAALFEHATSRALDPQLHTHALLINAGVMGEDGETRALVHTKIFGMKMLLGAIYRAELAAQLENRLSLNIGHDYNNGFGFVVRDVAHGLCEFFSKRRAEIEKLLGADGLESAKAAEIAAKESRDIKELIPARNELFKQWREIAAGFLFGPEQVHNLLGKAPVRHPGTEFQEAFHEALSTLEEDHSHFTRNELLEQVAEAAIGRGLNVSTIREYFDNALAQEHRIIHLGADKKLEERYTTAAIRDAETSMLKSVDALADRKSHGVNATERNELFKKYETERSALVAEARYHAQGFVKAVLRESQGRIDRKAIRKESAFVISSEQKEAVRHLTEMDGSDIRCLEGFAGTGKTTTLKVAREVWEKGGYEIIGTSLGGKAVEELRAGSGITSFTYAMLTTIMKDNLISAAYRAGVEVASAITGGNTQLLKPFKFSNRTVLVVDEAGMMDTHQICDLVQKVQKAGGMIVLVGDSDQLQAIGPGGAFRYIADRVGNAELSTIIRQRDARDREVVHNVRKADAAAALQSLDARGLVTVTDTRGDAINRLAADWIKAEAKAPADSLVFVGTKKDAAAVNELCQKGMKDAGLLRGRPVHGCGNDFYKGDRILLKETSRKFGVNNGDIGTIVGIQRSLLDSVLAVKLDRGKKVFLPLKKYSNIDLGYAVTTHKGQGSTVERAYILAGGSMQDKQISYVQVSRARDATRLYVSKHEAGKDLESLARTMSRSREKTLAATVSDHLQNTVNQEHTQRQRIRQKAQ